MATSQWATWYWDYHAAAKREGQNPLPQSSADLQQLYRQWAASGTPTPAEVVKWTQRQ